MQLINNILLAPYSLFLRARHFMYDHGIRKVSRASKPTICVGNITVGGTGKTPHTEMLLRLIGSSPLWKDKNIAVLSRGYMRKSKGFLEVTPDGSARLFGDEPLQIKKKFPDVTVVVDKNRVNGCEILCGAQQDTGRGKENVSLPRMADLIILEDAFQYRALDADLKVVLVDYNRPVFKDSLLPVGRLRDLPGRLSKADIVIVSKCPSYMNEKEADKFAGELGFRGPLFFTTMYYDSYKAVFPEGDYRYTHSKRLILFTGIANDESLFRYLSLKFRVVRHFQFGDHHKYSPNDIAMVRRAAELYATAVIMTTEKDAQRILDCKDVPKAVRERLFYVPMYADFLAPDEVGRFMDTVNGVLAGKKAGARSPEPPPETLS